MAQRLKTDWILFTTVVLMVLFGALMIYSASSVVADIKMGKSYYFAVRQLIWIGVAIPLMMFMKRLNYRKLQTPAVAFTAMGHSLDAMSQPEYVKIQKNAVRWLLRMS